MGTKLNRLMHNWPRGAVFTAKALKDHGIFKGDIAQYRKNKWLKAIGHGAYARVGDSPDWTGAVYALQHQLKLQVHVGGESALHMSGYGHFLPLSKMIVYLFSKSKTKLPKWFLEYDWNVDIRFMTNSLFNPFDFARTKLDIGAYEIWGASPERAILEVLHLIPKQQDFRGGLLLLENLTTLRPKLLQSLLENCTSIKVKRLFFFLADYLNHPWFKKLSVSRINLGSGKREIIKNGKLDKKYKITVPRDFAKK